MNDYLILKAVEHNKLPVKFKKQYPSIDALVAAGWWTQKKYDGCMGIAHMRFNGGSTMQSRTGEDYTTSCGSILEEIREAADEQGESWDDFVVIGEVWQPIEEAAFPTISGKFRKAQLAPSLKFIANDLLPPGLVTDMAYRLRFADLCELLPPLEIAEARVHVAETWQSRVDAAARAIEWQGMGGFDGAILRDPNAGYSIGTVKAGEIVKVKPTLSLDLLVEGRGKVQGEKTGRDVWTIVVTYNGVETSVGSGVPHHASDVPMRGQIAEIECLGITADGKLREPRFKSMRFDKVKAD
jgi:DNA ligase-1